MTTIIALITPWCPHHPGRCHHCACSDPAPPPVTKLSAAHTGPAISRPIESFNELSNHSVIIVLSEGSHHHHVVDKIYVTVVNLHTDTRRAQEKSNRVWGEECEFILRGWESYPSCQSKLWENLEQNLRGWIQSWCVWCLLLLVHSLHSAHQPPCSDLSLQRPEVTLQCRGQRCSVWRPLPRDAQVSRGCVHLSEEIFSWGVSFNSWVDSPNKVFA